MWIMGRRRQKHIQYADADPGRPGNVIELIYELSSDWGRAIRVIAIISFSLIALFVAAAIGVDIILLAAKGLKGLKSSNIITPAIFVGNWVIVLLVAAVRKSIAKSRARPGIADKQPARRDLARTRGQGRAIGKRRR
jgi:hypothetical protein